MINAMTLQNTQHAISSMRQLPMIDNLPISSRPMSGMHDASPTFGQVMNQALDSVNNLQLDADNQRNAIEIGTSDDLIGAMVASQKASISFSALLQVRNKVVSGFDDLMNLSI
jgi:flagellar hook-basal body complex protein FliE